MEANGRGQSGARAIDDYDCPAPPLPGVICEKTYRANPGGIAGGAVAGAVGVGSVVFVVTVVGALPVFFLLVLLAA